jgi:hypothetical protein
MTSADRRLRSSMDHLLGQASQDGGRFSSPLMRNDAVWTGTEWKPRGDRERADRGASSSSGALQPPTSPNTSRLLVDGDPKVTVPTTIPQSPPPPPPRTFCFALRH